MMHLDFIPRAKVKEALQSGWRLLPAHEYDPHDYAVLMFMPEDVEPLTDAQMWRCLAKVTPPASIRWKNKAAPKRQKVGA